MDMLSFAEELLRSVSRGEQLIGTRIFLQFATSRRFSEAAIRKLGTSSMASERLVEMLNWKSPAEEEIRWAAATVVSKIAGKKQNALMVAGIPGAMESISSLLSIGDCEHTTLNILGLQTLKKLAKEHGNCGKIGNTSGLLSKIINFTTATGQKLRRQNVTGSANNPDIKAAELALQVFKLLARTTGRTGELLRREISDIVFMAGNIREILQHTGEEGKPLQKLGLEILTSLAMEGEARERIGATGGVLRELMRIFFDSGRPGGAGREMWESVRVEAGEALAMLVVESERNCERILRVGGVVVVERFVEMVADSAVSVNACNVLRNLCEYGETDSDDQGFVRIRGAVKAFPMVLNNVMLGEMKLLEASIGLAAQIIRFMSPIEFSEQLERTRVSEIRLLERLVNMLRKYNYPSLKAPKIRRFVIELSIWMMQSNEKCIELFRNYQMEKEIEHIADTTTDVECFIVFSGYIGLTRHRRSMISLVERATKLLVKDIVY